ncbi:MAG: hypothetical protein DHS20C11_22470 [Lysobacteraceae bacterium]|nr:MAG: hypothetical protein DHS20C11_22470 [Xanthomonadaceae bacterium]
MKPLPWHQGVWDVLQRAESDGHLTHALLLVGESALQVAQFVTAFAAADLCEGESGQGACGQCRSCGWLKAGTHPDLRTVGLEEKKKIISIKQVRELTQSASKTTHLGHRVLVVDPADHMNVAAANALLKTLEEPPDNNRIVLGATRLDRLPATIVSRCQRYRLPAPTTQQAMDWLRDNASDVPASALDAASGCPLTAMQLNADGSAGLYSQRWQALFALCTGKGGVDALTSDPAGAIEFMNRAAASIAMAASGAGSQSADSKLQSRIVTLAERMSQRDWLQWQQLVARALEQCGTGINEGMLLDAALVDLRGRLAA